MELRQFRQSSGKPVEIVELKCSLRYAKEILGFCLPVGVSSNPDREPPLKPCRNQTTDIHRSVKTVGDMEDCQVLSNTGPGVSSSFWEREGWLGAAQHNLGNDLPKTIKLMVSMKADVTKPDSSLAFPFYCQNSLNEGGAPRMVL